MPIVVPVATDALAPEQLGRVYDRIGRIQDWQRFYEGPAVADLVAHADFEHARSVFELGCGTGAMALTLLDEVLPGDATYSGVDVSTRMVQLASERLAQFDDRATVHLVDGRPPLPGQSDRCDRFVAFYVFDLLAEPLARELLAEAERLLTADGKLCLVSLTHGTTGPSRAVCSVWNRAWRLAPAMLGGCRPIDLLPLLDRWEIEHTLTITAWAVPSQIVVATRPGNRG
jgi:ubiquinone/menaquinone biosynthesis C-methylase UbiE